MNCRKLDTLLLSHRGNRRNMRASIVIRLHAEGLLSTRWTTFPEGCTWSSRIEYFDFVGRTNANGTISESNEHPKILNPAVLGSGVSVPPASGVPHMSMASAPRCWSLRGACSSAVDTWVESE